MESDYKKFTISDVNYIDDPLEEEYLEFKIKGTEKLVYIVNAIRRILLDEIPTYAFTRSTINIEKNGSKEITDKIRTTILPYIHIQNLDPKKHVVKFLKTENYPYIPNIYQSIKSPKPHNNAPEDKYKIEYRINVSNNSNEIYKVTTNDIVTVVDNVEVKNMFDDKYPTLFLFLANGEEFRATMTGVLGVGKLDACFSAVSSRTYFNKISETEYIFFVRGYRQLPNYELLIRACSIIIIKAKMIYEQILLKISENKEESFIIENKNGIKTFEINIENETSTMGLLYSKILLNHSDVLYSGYNEVHPLVKTICLKLAINEKSNLSNIFKYANEYMDELFTHLKKQFKSNCKHVYKPPKFFSNDSDNVEDNGNDIDDDSK